MRLRFALALAALILFSAPVSRAVFYEGDQCDGAKKTQINPGEAASWCPTTVATQSQRVRVASWADCNWNADTSGTGAGSVTLTATKCSGSTTDANGCKNVLTDSTGSTTIVSGDPSGSFSISSGDWLITASGTAANGVLTCTGRN